jgi:hypothetical protein
MRLRLDFLPENGITPIVIRPNGAPVQGGRVEAGGVVVVATPSLLSTQWGVLCNDPKVAPKQEAIVLSAVMINSEAIVFMAVMEKTKRSCCRQ